MGSDVEVNLDESFVATVEIRRGPTNFVDPDILLAIGDAYEELDADPGCRAIVLCSHGKHFCAGVNLADDSAASAAAPGTNARIYAAGARLIAGSTPVVAAIQGAAVGGGLGLALTADFRVAGPEARFVANFARLGLHHGFGLTVTLPEVVGRQRAKEMLLMGERVNAPEALAIGLCDRLAPAGLERDEAVAFARGLAENAPLAVSLIRSTLRGDLIERFHMAVERERAEQDALRGTEDCAEGIRASTERRVPVFVGR